MWKWLSQKSVQGWVKNLSKYVAQHNWTDFDSKKGFFLSSFLFLFENVILPAERKIEKIRIKRRFWTDVWLKKGQFLDRFLTLQHIYIHISGRVSPLRISIVSFVFQGGQESRVVSSEVMIIAFWCCKVTTSDCMGLIALYESASWQPWGRHFGVLEFFSATETPLFGAWLERCFFATLAGGFRRCSFKGHFGTSAFRTQAHFVVGT